MANYVLDYSGIQVNSKLAEIADKAPIASPIFTGTPTAPTAAEGTNTTQIATTAFVMNTLLNNESMIFKGTLGENGTITSLPNSHIAGWTYKVITAGTYANEECAIDDLIICITSGTSANNDHWIIIHNSNQWYSW